MKSVKIIIKFCATGKSLKVKDFLLYQKLQSSNSTNICSSLFSFYHMRCQNVRKGLSGAFHHFHSLLWSLSRLRFFVQVIQATHVSRFVLIFLFETE